MSKTILKIPKPKNVKEAIELDSQLDYLNVPYDIHKEIHNDKNKEIQKLDLHGLYQSQEIIDQIRGYTPRIDETAKIIYYKDQPLRAVSGLFRRIPLAEVWEIATAKMGEPVEEFPTTQAIVCQFAAVSTKYQRDGSIAPEDYDLKPTIAFSYNFAERSFALGFVVGVFFCSNQMFLFFEGGVKVVHSKHHLKKFNLKDSIENLVGSVKTVEQKITEAQTTPVEDYQAPVLYWKGTSARPSYLKPVWEQHNKHVTSGNPATMWSAMNHITWVTSHRIPNKTTSFDMSSKAGNLLYSMGILYKDDYVRSLGFYMKAKREAAGFGDKADNWLDTVKLDPLKDQVSKIILESLNPPAKPDEEVKTEKDPFKHSQTNRHRINID